jgi:CheY-like chemotaxis protein
VASRKGHGATFSIYLPASGKTEMLESARDESVAQGSGMVLFVDDDEVNLEVGAGLLTALGYQPMTASGGRQAVELYERFRDRIDMVVLDMIMPEMDGGQVFDRLRQIDPDVKVLLSSGYSLDGQAKEIMERGCSGFIQKPFNLNSLSRKIREILEKE